MTWAWHLGWRAKTKPEAKGLLFFGLIGVVPREAVVSLVEFALVGAAVKGFPALHPFDEGAHRVFLEGVRGDVLLLNGRLAVFVGCTLVATCGSKGQSYRDYRKDRPFFHFRFSNNWLIHNCSKSNYIVRFPCGERSSSVFLHAAACGAYEQSTCSCRRLINYVSTPFPVRGNLNWLIINLFSVFYSFTTLSANTLPPSSVTRSR